MDNNGMPDEIYAYGGKLDRNWNNATPYDMTDKYAKYIRADLAAAPTPDNNGWMPISSAPKDGTQIYVDAPQLESGCTIAYFEKGHWRSAWDGKPFGFHVKQPTKWQPLPPPPALDKGE